MLRNLFVGVSMLLAMTLSAQSEKENCPDRIWMQSNAWNNGWNVSAHPSINAKEFHEQYIKNKEVMGCHVLLFVNRGSSTRCRLDG